MTKFVALYDVHFGWERRNGHKIALHDKAALQAALQFVADFKPDVTILGGDILDCGCISHHNKGKPGAVEGMRLIQDAQELRTNVLDPIESATKKDLRYVLGNHERWLEDLSNNVPALEGMLDIEAILRLGPRWSVIPQGDATKLGKLVFIHGDQIKGGENAAKNAVSAYERNVVLGHFHTSQTYSKTSAVDMNGHTGTVVPCLCRKRPGYGGGAPNKWMQGFMWGYVNEATGLFNSYTSIIINGKFIANGKEWGK